MERKEYKLCGFKEYLKDKIITIGLLIFAIITIEIFLMIYPVGSFIKIYIPIVIAFMYIIRNFSRVFYEKKILSKTI